MKLMKMRVEVPVLHSLFQKIWLMATSTTREKFINLGLNVHVATEFSEYRNYMHQFNISKLFIA